MIEGICFAIFLGAFILRSPELKRVFSNRLSIGIQRWKEKYSNNLLQISNKLISKVIVGSSLRFLNTGISGFSEAARRMPTLSEGERGPEPRSGFDEIFKIVISPTIIEKTYIVVSS